MVQVNFQQWGVLLIWIIVGQGPTALWWMQMGVVRPFLSPTGRFGGYSDEPGVRPPVLFCPLNNLKTVWNILMILHSYVE